MEGGPGGLGRWGVYLVDLPGYGYARGGDDAAAELAAIALDYYQARAPLSATLILVDSRHPGLRADLDAVDWLNRLDVTYQIVATKIDKLSRSERVKNLKTLETTFGMAALPISATSGEGMDELWRTIARFARTAA